MTGCFLRPPCSRLLPCLELLLLPPTDYSTGVEGFTYNYYEDLTTADVKGIVDTLRKGGKPKVGTDTASAMHALQGPAEKDSNVPTCRVPSWPCVPSRVGYAACQAAHEPKVCVVTCTCGPANHTCPASRFSGSFTYSHPVCYVPLRPLCASPGWFPAPQQG